eukprot:289250-Rhodomonas_salina.2
MCSGSTELLKRYAPATPKTALLPDRDQDRDHESWTVAKTVTTLTKAVTETETATVRIVWACGHVREEGRADPREGCNLRGGGGVEEELIRSGGGVEEELRKS